MSGEDANSRLMVGKKALGMIVMPVDKGFLVGYSLSLKLCENP